MLRAQSGSWDVWEVFSHFPAVGTAEAMNLSEPQLPHLQNGSNNSTRPH